MNLEAYFKISYGLYVVTSKAGSKINGFISNTVFQVTAEPPQFAIACSKNNFTAGMINESKIFAVSVLRKETSAFVISNFGYKSGKEADKFAGIKYRTGTTGAPIVLDDTIAWMECEVIQTIDMGSHCLFIGKVIDIDILDPAGEPLTYAYYREVKKGKAPKNAPTYIDDEKLKAAPNLKKADQYYCPVCGYVYDPEKGDPSNGIPAGTPFDNLPDNWVCPVCGTPGEDFIKKTNT